MEGIRVVLADDHPFLRAGLRSVLESDSDIQIVAEAAEGNEAWDLVQRHRPHVLVTDIAMPGLDGLGLTARVVQDFPDTRVLILSVHKDKAYAIQAVTSGASGYLLKEAGTNELAVAIRAIARGESYLSPSISAHLLSDYLRLSEDSKGDDSLTPRQLDVLALVAQGLPTKTIARRLGLSVKTVEAHRSELMKRLDIHDVAGLVRHALRIGLIKLEN